MYFYKCCNFSKYNATILLYPIHKHKKESAASTIADPFFLCSTSNVLCSKLHFFCTLTNSKPFKIYRSTFLIFNIFICTPFLDILISALLIPRRQPLSFLTLQPLLSYQHTLTVGYIFIIRFIYDYQQKSLLYLYPLPFVELLSTQDTLA